MKSISTIVILAGSFFVFLSLALALPKDETDDGKEIRSPAVDDDDFSKFQEDQPAEFSIGNIFSGRIGKFFNDFLQFPAIVFRFVSGIIANQPFAKLREEVRTLNISYPK